MPGKKCKRSGGNALEGVVEEESVGRSGGKRRRDWKKQESVEKSGRGGKRRKEWWRRKALEARRRKDFKREASE